MRQIIAVLFLLAGLRIATMIDQKGTADFLIDFVKSIQEDIRKMEKK